MWNFDEICYKFCSFLPILPLTASFLASSIIIAAFFLVFGLFAVSGCTSQSFCTEQDKANITEIVVEKLDEAFLNETGRELKLECIHGGIEAGYFKKLYPEMDIVTIGPLVLDEHMVTERLDLKSFDEIWRVLVKVIAEL